MKGKEHMYNNKKVTALLLAGGSGTRFGANGNKVYVEILGKPILQYSLEVLANHPMVDQCILVVKKGEEEIAREIVAGANLADSSKIAYAEGGATRQESVYHGLCASDGDIVLIHDSARPMIRPSYIDACLASMDRVPGSTIAVRSKDTIKLSDENGLVVQTTVRANTWVVQTPQCFDLKILKAAHETYKDAPGITDDCSILELAGEPVQLLEGDYTNIKVTTPEDRELAEAFLGDL